MSGYANLTAILSGNESIGKTWIAMGLAESFSAAGEKVLLVDTDIGFGNLAERLKITPDIGLYDALTGNATLNQAVAFYPEGGFDVIVAGTGVQNIADIPASSFLTIKNDLLLLARNYDRVIIDCQTGTGNTPLLFAAASRQALIVVNDNAPSIRSAYALTAELLNKDICTNIAMTVNLATSPKDGERVYFTLADAAQKFLKSVPKWAGAVRKNNFDDILYLAKELTEWTW